MSLTESPLERLALLDRDERETMLAEMAAEKGIPVASLKMRLLRSWRFTARPKQLAPDGDWVYWWIRAGRGFGKTLSAAEWTKARALERRCRIGLIAPIRADIRATMVEGVSGLLSVIPSAALEGQSREFAWNRTTLELKLANQTVLTGFSSERPDRLRGPEHDYIWGEEVSSWDDANVEPTKDHTTWSNMQMTLRAAADPKIVLTSTPKTNKMTRYLAGLNPRVMRTVTGSSWENKANLSDIWWDEVIVPILGTRTGRQEIEGELLEDVEGALWTLALIEAGRVPVETPEYWIERMRRIVVAVDPNTTSGETADDAGVVVCGKGHDDQHGYVLDDRTTTSGGPMAWARAAVAAYHDWKADKIVAEKNQGGEMVAITIKTVDPSVPVKLVDATSGKRTRAEPVSTMYGSLEMPEENPCKVHHCGAFPELEDEMTTWTGGRPSPNRMDALVWGMSDLKLWTRTDRRGSFVPQGDIPGTDMYEQTVGGGY